MRKRLSALLIIFALSPSCKRWRSSSVDVDAGTAFAPYTDADVSNWVYREKLSSQWADFGYAPHRSNQQGAEEVDLSNWGGWILAAQNVDWRMLGDLTFHYKSPEDLGNFIEVRLFAGGDADPFPKVIVTPKLRIAQDGWNVARISMNDLNPSRVAFDRFRIRAARKESKAVVTLRQISFLIPEGSDGGSPPPPPSVPATLAVHCKAPGHVISPYIYGITSSHLLDTPYKELGAIAGRWGGNTSSRYNWVLGNAWNAGSDWFFRNLNYGQKADFSWRAELDHNRRAGVPTAVTIPMLGWVAKDVTSFSFPVAEVGSQDAEDKGAGNGMRDNKPLPSPNPAKTSIPAPPEFVSKWVETIRADDAKHGGKSDVMMYFLDNEPSLWSDTHRDVHPDELSYDELLDKTVRYASAIRKVAPDALLAGPSDWGWSAYFYSPVDLKAGHLLRPDRRKHGDVPFLQWYLAQLYAHEKKTGVKLLDVLDVHFYPQAKGIGIGETGGIDPATASLRIRSTRSVWDETYVDESWIKEAVNLIPTLKGWVAQHYPGLKISIGEYNWGAEHHISGGLALAEVLGRFGEADIYSAFYWRYPKPQSPAGVAFRLYGNYDGQGARFPSRHVKTTKAKDVSLFAARDEASGQLVLIALNFNPSHAVNASIDLDACGGTTVKRMFAFDADSEDLVPVEDRASINQSTLFVKLPPASMSVIELEAK